ncbi:MAG TPA: dihydrodipicolinate synthase family protein [Gryllotalpicola sp.]
MTVASMLGADGAVTRLDLGAPRAVTRPAGPLSSRVVYAAAHVVPNAWGDNTPGRPAELDWDTTLAFRHHVWSWGLGVADAMDTAQRNMGLDAIATRELIARSAAEAASVGGALIVGVNTDHVKDEAIGLDTIVAAYLEQLAFAEDHGAGVVLMASRHLARAAAGPDDYRRVYGRVLERAQAPVVLHWLGEAFDPALRGYFGSADAEAAASVLIDIIGEHSDKVSGVKMSLLDAEAEVAVRGRLPRTARMFTGDDFNYVGLIAGNGSGMGAEQPGSYSDALLGAFAAFPTLASASVQALDRGDRAGYFDVLGPTEALARRIFAAPTFYYKTGVAFLSWLNGHQPAFAMVGGLHAARSLPHLSEIVRLADAAGALEDPELAAARWGGLLELNGVHVPGRVTV